MAFHADRDHLDRFIRSLFTYADQDTFVSLRAFDQHDSKKPAVFIQTHKINGDLTPLIDSATRAADRAANGSSPAVFAPPICTFSNADRARTEDLANGLALSVEIDAGDTAYCRKRLEGIFGPCTLVMASGSEWSDPLTGEIFPKLHLHWRLSEPTREASDHTKLRQARDLAAQLVGADPTGKPIVHPLRWAGSWNLKGKPVLAKIIAFNDTSEIHLDEALGAIEEAVEAAGFGEQSLPASNGKPEAPLPLVASAMAAIPNAGMEVHYDHWMRMGYAVYRATAGAGYDIWDEWSKKSDKYNAAEQEAGWGRISRAITSSSVPRPIGAGTIFFHAVKEGWVRPGAEPPDDITDPGYWTDVYGQARHVVGAHDQEHEIRGKAEEPPKERTPQPFPATGISWEEFTVIPPRERVYGHFLFRKFISALGAPGGAGKTAYAFAVALAIVTGRNLLDEVVHEPGNVWIYNLEDPRTELMRRIKAACVEHDVAYGDIADRLFVDSGRDRPMVIARTDKNGNLIAWPQVEDLKIELKEKNIRLLIVDPFVRSHRVEENVNDQIDFVAALWAEVADAADCAILLVHHFKKGGTSGEAAAFRGASALIDASRSAVTLATMSQAEADKLGVQEKDRWQHIRVDNAKLNLAPPPDDALWLRLVGVDLGNAERHLPADSVQTVKRWKPSSPWEGADMGAVVRILERLNDGPGEGEQYFLTGGTGARWAGTVVIEETGKTPEQAKVLLSAWKRNGVIESTRYHSPADRKERAGLTVNMGVVAEMRRGNYSNDE